MFGSKSTFKESQVIQDIQAGGLRKQRAEASLYDRFTYLIAKGKSKHFLADEQAVDAYADAVIAVVDHIGKGTFRKENKISTLIHRIYFNKCVDVLRKKTNTDKWSWLPEEMQIPDKAKGLLKQIIEREEVEGLVRLMEKLGKSCKEILWYSIYDGMSAKEIAGQLGFSGAASVMSKKSMCLKKLRGLIARR